MKWLSIRRLVTNIASQQTHPQRPSSDPVTMLYVERLEKPTSPATLRTFNSYSCILGKKWFDCSECHTEQETHPLMQKFEMIFACKKCKKCFRKDAREFEDADEYCPHCDNHFVLEAKIPTAALKVEGEDARKDSRMLKDDRVKEREYKTIFDPDDDADRLG